MRCLVLFPISLAALLSGCAAVSALPAHTQNYWRARPIHELEQQLGPATQVSQQGNGKRYVWTKSDTRWMTIAPGQKVAGFKMVNGKNVATTINGPAIKNLQTVSCQIMATTNANNRIIEINSHSNGLSCHNLTSRL